MFNRTEVFLYSGFYFMPALILFISGCVDQAITGT